MVIHAFLSFIITLFMSHTYGTLSKVYEFPRNMMDPSSSANLLQVYAFFSFSGILLLMQPEYVFIFQFLLDVS